MAWKVQQSLAQVMRVSLTAQDDPRNEPEAFQRKLARAVQLAPNWADPLKAWGDMLAAQGRSKEALSKYDAAVKLAPEWAQLRRARAMLQARAAR